MCHSARCGLLRFNSRRWRYGEPAQAEAEDNAYVFERRVVFLHGDGSSSNGYIDCYRRTAFILEAKQTRLAEDQGKVFDAARLPVRIPQELMLARLAQSEQMREFFIEMWLQNPALA